MDNLGNQNLFERLEGIQAILKARHKAGKGSSSATKGNDREYFINKFLAEVFPPQFRFGHGDITDLSGKISGQVDIVVEYPFFPSLPMSQGSSRLYLAEGVAAVIEVKSNLKSQWNQVKKTSDKLVGLKRSFGCNEITTPRWIPLFVVGYEGWQDEQKLKEKIEDRKVDGILVINPGLFVWNPPLYIGQDSLTQSARGAWALWAFVVSLHHITMSLRQTNFAPALYAMPDILLFHKIYSASHVYTNGEVVVFNITDKEGINRGDAKQMIASLEKDKLLNKVYDTDELIIVSVTESGKLLGYKLVEMLR
ncbi:hypothetical protein H6F74_09140 [Trichocoleus sp. FACHB-90]|uniref:DUF6602 domain-containing protein n=1 Tax=Cyanophyceae TaxID=3028117 RepID=UPI00168977C1|nr:DUF6602 domain-containing protein [Trichocoleus sp. FACHB-90]MBD1926412.1 hypothetical protein [Trichocoleus sp. FACHB-90]